MDHTVGGEGLLAGGNPACPERICENDDCCGGEGRAGDRGGGDGCCEADGLMAGRRVSDCLARGSGVAMLALLFDCAHQAHDAVASG